MIPLKERLEDETHEDHSPPASKKHSAFRIVIATIPFIIGLIDCTPKSGTEDSGAAHLLSGDSSNHEEPYYTAKCGAVMFATLEPWNLIFIVWLSSVCVVMSFQLESHFVPSLEAVHPDDSAEEDTTFVGDDTIVPAKSGIAPAGDEVEDEEEATEVRKMAEPDFE